MNGFDWRAPVAGVLLLAGYVAASFWAIDAGLLDARDRHDLAHDRAVAACQRVWPHGRRWRCVHFHETEFLAQQEATR